MESDPDELARRRALMDRIDKMHETRRLEEAVLFDPDRVSRLGPPLPRRLVNDQLISFFVSSRFTEDWLNSDWLVAVAEEKPEVAAEAIQLLIELLAELLVLQGQKFRDDDAGRDPIVLLQRMLSRHS